MPVNPRSLKPIELLRLLNATHLGTTSSRCRMYRQQDQGGRQIGDGETIDIVRYASWLFLAWWERSKAELESSLPEIPEARESAPRSMPLNPLSLTPAEVALLLAKSGGKPVTEAMVRAAMTKGCPVDAQGRLNLVHLAAWLNKETVDGD